MRNNSTLTLCTGWWYVPQCAIQAYASNSHTIWTERAPLERDRVRRRDAARLRPSSQVSSEILVILSRLRTLFFFYRVINIQFIFNKFEKQQERERGAARRWWNQIDYSLSSRYGAAMIIGSWLDWLWARSQLISDCNYDCKHASCNVDGNALINIVNWFLDLPTSRLPRCMQKCRLSSFGCARAAVVESLSIRSLMLWDRKW